MIDYPPIAENFSSSPPPEQQHLLAFLRSQARCCLDQYARNDSPIVVGEFDQSGLGNEPPARSADEGVRSAAPGAPLGPSARGSATAIPHLASPRGWKTLFPRVSLYSRYLRRRVSHGCTVCLDQCDQRITRLASIAFLVTQPIERPRFDHEGDAVQRARLD